jgi:hypothetical protein
MEDGFMMFVFCDAAASCTCQSWLFEGSAGRSGNRVGTRYIGQFSDHLQHKVTPLGSFIAKSG